jgi:hypothetical protein
MEAGDEVGGFFFDEDPLGTARKQPFGRRGLVVGDEQGGFVADVAHRDFAHGVADAVQLDGLVAQLGAAVAGGAMLAQLRPRRVGQRLQSLTLPWARWRSVSQVMPWAPSSSSTA